MYTLTPLANKVFGAEIRNISLSTVKLNDELIQRIKQDLAKHRLLVFKVSEVYCRNVRQQTVLVQ
jgi:hypothetical protein